KRRLPLDARLPLAQEPRKGRCRDSHGDLSLAPKSRALRIAAATISPHSRCRIRSHAARRERERGQARPEAAGHLGRGQARERDWSRGSQRAGENRTARRAGPPATGCPDRAPPCLTASRTFGLRPASPTKVKRPLAAIAIVCATVNRNNQPSPNAVETAITFTGAEAQSGQACRPLADASQPGRRGS